MDNSRHKKSRKPIQLSDEDHAKYVKESQRLHEKNVTMGEMAGYFMDLHLKYNFYNNGWVDALKESVRQIERNQYQELDTACHALAWIKENWVCVKSSAKGTVKLKVLGPDQRDADNACSACKRDKNIEKRWTEILKKDRKGWTCAECPVTPEMGLTNLYYCTKGNEAAQRDVSM